MTRVLRTSTLKRVALLSAIASVAVAGVAAPAAQAGSVKAGGQVIAPPSSYKGKLGVPVLLSQSAQKSLRLSSPIVRLLVGKNERVAAPNKARIAAVDVKAGDDVTAKVKRAKKKATIASLSASGLTVTGRQGALSNSDLQTAVFELARQYFGTTAQQDQRMQSLDGRIAKLESGSSQSAIAGLQNDVANLTTTVSGLTTSLNGLTGQLNGLNSLVNSICHVPVVDLVVACPS